MTEKMTTPTQALLSDLPRLHRWGGRPQVGGLNNRLANRMITEIQQYKEPEILETGSGATTLLFLSLAPRRVTSVAPDRALHERVLAEAAARSIDTGALRLLTERSEVALPRLSEAGEAINVALIDGHHGWPTVFVDFCYMNRMLERGGVLFVDDIQLYSVNQLFLLLRQQEEFEFVALEEKMATFRKVKASDYLPDWRAEPFIEMNSVIPDPAPPFRRP